MGCTFAFSVHFNIFLWCANICCFMSNSGFLSPLSERKHHDFLSRISFDKNPYWIPHITKHFYADKIEAYSAIASRILTIISLPDNNHIPSCFRYSNCNTASSHSNTMNVIFLWDDVHNRLMETIHWNIYIYIQIWGGLL